MKKSSILLSFLILISTFLIAPQKVAAQPGTNDPSFNPIDQGFDFGSGANSLVRASCIQPDGKIIIGGAFTSYGISRNRIARLNVDGSLDNSFDPGVGVNDEVRTISIQPDGKIIIGGLFTSFNGTFRNRIARLNADGSLDNSFDTGVGANTHVFTSCIQPDGKIIIGGSFTSYNGISRNRIARLNVDGSLDTSFDPGSGASDVVYASSIQPDGKIIIGGNLTSYNGTSRNHIARLNTDGSLDTSFDPGSGANDTVYIISIQSDGKIIIGGNLTSYNGTSRNTIARLNADGSLDTSFDPGSGATHTVQTTSIQSDGKIIIGGYFTSYNGTSLNHIARLNADGSLDTSFNTGSGANTSVATSFIQPDGKIIIGGGFTSYNGTSLNRIARLNADGSLDTSFNAGSGANSIVYASSIQPDGKIIIGGSFVSYNGTSRTRIARLNADGSLDTSFDPGSGANDAVYTISIQSDGKIIIGGDFTSYNGTSRNTIARLNANGSLDTSFDPGSGATHTVQTISIQSDGKIIIGGYFTNYNGISRNSIARLNANGSLDTSFDPGSGTNTSVATSFIQPDGKIIIGGSFTSYNGISRNRIARLNADGSLDTSFDPGLGATHTVQTSSIQSDGKIIIGGDFTSYNGTSRNYIARLNADGSLDTSFNPGSGAFGIVRTSSMQLDGKIIIGGDFTHYNGIFRNRIARLNADGSLDTSFNPGSGANNLVWTSSIQSDGKIIIGGFFTSYNGIGRNRVARVFVNVSIEWIGTTDTDWNTGSNWSSGTVPGASDNVTIPFAPVNQPHVTSSQGTPALCTNINIESGAVLTIDAGKALTGSGDTDNEGTMLVKADVTGIGSFIDNGTITGAGSFQMEQYLTGAGAVTPNGLFYYVSSPVAGATSFVYDAAGDNKLWSANENTQSYSLIEDNVTGLNLGQGYVARLGATSTLTFDGSSFNTGNQSASGLTRTGTTELNRGYNLVGNPYPSTVSWDAATKTNLETSMYYRTHQGSSMLYDTYNAVNSIGTNNNLGGAVTGAIPPTQAFWVRVDFDGNTGELDFTNAMRSHGTLSGIYRMAAEEGTVRIALSNGTNSDEGIIFFEPSAQDGYDAYDSQKFWAGASVPQLYTTVGTDSLVINGLSSIAANPVVDLGVKLPAAGEYTFDATSITLNENVHLEDRYLGIFQDLNAEPTYAFTSSVAGNIPTRFALHFGMAVTGIEDGEVMKSRVYTSNGNQLNIILSGNTEAGNVQVLDMVGRIVRSANLNASRTTLDMNTATGVYLIRVETEKGTDTHRIVIN
jgi:uncharacterized delta-60 repeat protein